MDLATAQSKARELMDAHGLEDWKFQWSRTRTEIAACSYDRIIYMSKYYPGFASDSEFRLVMLHEIAHALLPMEHGHDDVWKELCIRIGGDGKRLVHHSDKFQEAASLYAVVCAEGEILDYCNSKSWSTKDKYCAEHHKPVKVTPNPNRVV